MLQGSRDIQASRLTMYASLWIRRLQDIRNVNVEFIFQLGNLAIEPARSEGIAHACGGKKTSISQKIHRKDSRVKQFIDSRSL